MQTVGVAAVVSVLLSGCAGPALDDQFDDTWARTCASFTERAFGMSVVVDSAALIDAAELVRAGRSWVSTIEPYVVACRQLP